MALVSYNSTLTEWENIIRVKLKVTNPILIKSGALGVLTNYLAGIKYDSLEFYSKVFQEMNVGLAQDFNSMLYHSTIYGTKLEFAVPSTLSSTIIVPEVTLGNVDELIYIIPRYATFNDSNGMNYIYISEIRLSVSNSGIYATAWNPQQGTKKLTITKAANPNLPQNYVYLIHNSDAQQYKRDFYTEMVPSYDVGDSFSFSIGIDSVLKLKEVNAWINTGDKLNDTQLLKLRQMDPEDIEGAEFDGIDAEIKKLNIKFYKFDSSVRDQDIFLELFENSLSFETGDGVHGAVLQSKSQLIIEVDTTEGSLGNVANSEYLLSNISVTEKYAGGLVDRVYNTTLNGLSTTGSTGGKNIEQIDGIRENIFNQITIRNSVITENDYERLFKYQDNKPFVDAKFLDARSFVFIFNVIHDNDNIVKSTSINYKESNLISNPFYPIIDYGGYSLISPFYYKNNGVNTVDAYLVNPNIPFSLMPENNNSENILIGDYRVDIGLVYEFYSTQNGMSGKSYIQIFGNPSGNYEYYFYCSWLENGAYIVLNSANGFKYEISTMYTDPYCIVRENTTNIRMEVFDVGTTSDTRFSQNLVASFVDNGTYHQLIKKQSFYKYFQEITTPTPPNIITTRNTISYLDNEINNIMTTVNDIVEINDTTNSETYLLRLPFIDSEWFFSKDPSEMFDIFNSYFIVNYIEENINYNTQLVQSFHNTIDIPSLYYPYLFEETTMSQIDNPKMSIELELFLDKDAFIVSKYETMLDFEISAKIEIINYMKEKEGFSIDFFETDLEKHIYNLFNPMIKNIKVITPTMFRVNNSAVIYNLMQETLEFEDILNFTPPYFYYDYNINLKITM